MQALVEKLSRDREIAKLTLLLQILKIFNEINPDEIAYFLYKYAPKVNVEKLLEFLVENGIPYTMENGIIKPNKPITKDLPRQALPMCLMRHMFVNNKSNAEIRKALSDFGFPSEGVRNLKTGNTGVFILCRKSSEEYKILTNLVLLLKNFITACIPAKYAIHVSNQSRKFPLNMDIECVYITNIKDNVSGVLAVSGSMEDYEAFKKPDTANILYIVGYEFDTKFFYKGKLINVAMFATLLPTFAFEKN